MVSEEHSESLDDSNAANATEIAQPASRIQSNKGNVENVAALQPVLGADGPMPQTLASEPHTKSTMPVIIVQVDSSVNEAISPIQETEQSDDRMRR